MVIARFITISISTIIYFYDGRNQDIALGDDFDNESIEFYKKLADHYDYEGKKCRSRRVYSEHYATFAIDNFEYATFGWEIMANLP